MLPESLWSSLEYGQLGWSGMAVLEEAGAPCAVS